MPPVGPPLAKSYGLRMCCHIATRISLGFFGFIAMSATLDAAVATFFGRCPVVNVPGRTFPLDVMYRPNVPVPRAIEEVLAVTLGTVLCFLPCLLLLPIWNMYRLIEMMMGQTKRHCCQLLL